MMIKIAKCNYTFGISVYIYNYVIILGLLTIPMKKKISIHTKMMPDTQGKYSNYNSLIIIIVNQIRHNKSPQVNTYK